MSGTREVDHRIVADGGVSIFCRDYPGPGQPGPGQSVPEQPDIGNGPGAAPVLCLPGLTRNSRDFEPLAQHLAQRRRVLTPDLRGRGRSDRDPEWRRYRLDVYVADMVALLDALAIPQVVVVGTSLGGLVGMFLAAGHRSRVAGLVMNDIGPELDPRGMQRIASGMGRVRTAATWEEAVADARAANGFALPGLDEVAWLRFARAVYREEAPGRIVRDVDPAVGRALADPSLPVPDFWAAFATLRGLPMLCLRGETSDVLSADTVRRMSEAAPGLQTVTIPDRGHAPTLDEPSSREALDRFLGAV
jgi:pimeloyl-ACP methyl ester carboxylesterase